MTHNKPAEEVISELDSVLGNPEIKFALQLHLKNSISYLDRGIGAFLDSLKVPAPYQRLPKMFTDDVVNGRWDSFIEKNKTQIGNDYSKLVEFLEILLGVGLLDTQGIKLLKEKNIELATILQESPTSE